MLKVPSTLLVLILLGLCACASRPELAAPSTIAHLDMPRYLGTWYEIAKYPNRFQQACVKNTRAEYSLQQQGTLQVINRCIRTDGTEISATGQARPLGPAGTPKLEVRFAPAWLSWLPIVWGNYWVIDLDDAYSLAAVSEPGRNYLWILSRNPQANPTAYAALLQRLEAQGFDLKKLQASPQDLLTQ